MKSATALKQQRRRSFLETLENRSLLATLYWQGDASNAWSNVNNWTTNPAADTAPAVAPVSGDLLHFDTATFNFNLGAGQGFTPSNDIAGLSNLSLVVNDSSAVNNFTLAGVAAGLSATGVTSNVSVGTAATISMPLNVAGSNFDVVGGDLAVSGIVGGTSLTKSNTGILILSGANAFTGGVTVNGGTLSIAADANLGAAPGAFTANYITLDGGTLRTTNAANFAINTNRGFTLGAGGGTLNLAASSVNYAGAFAGANPLTKIGSDLILNGALASANSALNVNSGRIFYNNVNNILGTGPITVASGAGIVYQPTTANASFTLANSITVNSGGNLASRSGTGALTLSGVVTLPTSGTILFNLDDAGTGTLTMNNAANAIAATGDLTFQIGLDGFGGGIAYTPTNGVGIGQVNLNHLISGAVNLTKRAGGTLALTNSGNTFGGAGNTITILGGNLSVSADAQLGNAANSITFSNPRTGPIGSGQTGGENILNKQFDLQTGNANMSALWTGTFTPAVNGVHTFSTNSDDGSMFFIDADLDGDFESIAGERVVNNNGSQGLTTVSGNTAALTAGTPYPIAIVYFQGAGGGGITARWAAGAGVAVASQAIVDPSDPAQAGRWSSIHGVNTLEERVYTGSPGSDYLDNAGIGLDDDGVTRSLLNQAPLPTGLLNIAGNFTSARSIILNSQGGLNINSGNTLTHTGLISGADVGAGMGADNYNGLNAGLTKAGAGTLVLNTANNTYLGPTSIRGGVLEVNALNNGGAPGRLGQSSSNASNLWLDGGTLRYNGAAAASTDRSFTLTTAGGTIENNSAAVTSTLTLSNTAAPRLFTPGSSTPMTETPPYTPPVGARTLTLSGSNVGANVFAAALTDDVVGASVGQTRLTKSGNGTWIVNNNASSYTGVTTINTGVLRVTAGNALGVPGTAPGGTQVQSGATLELNGNFTLAAKPILLNGSGFGNAGAMLATGNVTVPGRIGQNGSTTIRATTGSNLMLTGSMHKDVNNATLTFAGGGNITVDGAIGDVAADYTISSLTGRGYLASNQSITTAATINNLTAPVSVPVESDSVSLAGALNFPNDAAIAAVFGNAAYNTTNPYTAVFFGILNVTTAGTYSFGANPHDDTAVVWVDDDGNGVFETTGVSDLVFSSGCCNSATIGVRTLAPGSYKIAYANVDTGGGGSLVGRMQGPIAVGQASSALLNIINPAATTTGTNDVVINSGGTVTFTGANTYSGTTTVNNGVLLLDGPAAALGSTAAGTIVNENGTLALQGGVTINGEDLTIDGLGAPGQLGALVNVSGNNTISAASTINARPVSLGEIRFASLANQLTIAAPIDLVSSKLSVDGSGNMVISGSISGTGVDVGAAPAAGVSNVFADVPEASGYTLALEHNNLPGSVNGAANFPYTLNNTGSIGAFDRIAYYLELEGGANAPTREYVYVSMDAFTTNLAQIGVPAAPTKWSFQRFVSNMNIVASPSSGVTSGTGLESGNIEIWPSNYGQGNTANVPNASSAGNNSGFDFGDGGFSNSDGHGSFQIHNFDLDGDGAGTAGETLIAYNQWRQANPSLGIGNNPTGAASGFDWTFVNNLTSYNILKRMSILVRELNPSYRQTDNSLEKLGSGTLTLSGTNTYNGTTSVNAGVLQVQNGAAIFNTAGPVNVANLATLQLLSSETISSYVGADDGANENDSVLALGSNTLTTTGSATIANVTSANGRLVAGTAIIDGDTDNNVSGTGVFLQAGTTVGTLANPIETTVANLEGSAGTGFFVASSTALTIGGVSASTGIAATGDIVVTSTSTLTVAENVSVSGAGSDVTLTAIDAAGAGQDLTVNAGVTISSPAGVITLNAGDIASIAGTLASGNNILVNIDAGNADPGAGGTLNFSGDVDAPLAIFSGVGDTFGDVFNIRPDQDTGHILTPIQVFGLAPAANPNGDALSLNITGLGIPTLTLGPGARNGVFGFGSAAATVQYNDIENVTTNPALPYHLVLDMRFAGYQNGAADTIVAQLNAAGDTLLIDVNAANVFTGPDNVIQSLTVIGSADNDAFTINETAGGLPRFLGAAPIVNNTGVGGGVSNGSHLNSSADLVLEALRGVQTPWDSADVTIHFDGGVGGNDSLAVNFTTLNNTGYFADTSDAGNSGNLLAAPGAFPAIGAPNLLLSFANVEPLVLAGAGGALLADATGTPTSNLALTDIGAQSQITGDGGIATTTFSGYNGVAVVGGNGAETIDLISVEGAGLVSVTLLGGNTNDLLSLPGGDTAGDTLRVRSLPSTTAALLLGNAGSDLFQLFDAGNTVDNIQGPVTVDGTDGNVMSNTDTLEIVDIGDISGDSVVIAAVNPGASQDYSVEGITSTAGNDVTLRNIDVLNYTGTSDNDTIDGRFVNTAPAHDLTSVSLSGWMGADQFLLFTSDQIGGSGAGFTPTATASGVANIALYGDAPGNPNAGDGNDTFGATPVGVVGTGVTNVGLVVSDATRMIRPSASTSIAIDGGRPSGLAAPLGDVTGDVLNVDISALPNSTPVIVSTYAPGTVVAAGIQPLTWTEIEDINVVDQGKLTNVQMGDLFARTTPGADLVQITRNPTTLNPNQVRLRITASIGNYSASNKTIIYGGDSNDVITQSNLTIPAEFYGEGGDDYLSGAMNNDWLVGGIGSDRINGSGGDNVIWGDNAPTLPTDPQPQDLAVGGNDQLSGLGGNDVFYGGGGDDLVSAGGGNDYAYGGQGNDTLDGHDGDDRLYGGLGNDNLSGHAGNDLLSGSEGSDQLQGGTGNDVLLAGNGADLLGGGDGNDLLVSGSVLNENSSWTSLASTSTYSPATYTRGSDNDAALLSLLAQWGSASNPGSIGAISHDGANDDLYGGTGDDDFCWETADVLDNLPGITPADYNATGMGSDERIGPM